MRRRDFLRGIGATTVGAVMSGCSRAFQLSSAAMLGPQASMSSPRDPNGWWQEALAYARWTPSPHNIQPWRLRLVRDDFAELYFDPRRGLPLTDTDSAFTSMSLAMFVEHLSVALAARGVCVRGTYALTKLNYASVRPTLFAQLQLGDSHGVGTEDAIATRNLLLVRKTSRLPYDGRQVDDGALKALARTAESFGHNLNWSHDPQFVRDTLELNRQALFNDLGDTVSRTELKRWIRTSDEDAGRTKDGLWAHCLQYPGWLLRDFFNHHERWAHGARAALTSRLLLRGMRGTRTIAWWSGGFSSPQDFIDTGRVLSRSWLELANRGVQLHPFGSVVTNERAHGAFRTQLGADAPAQTIWLLARLGYSAQPPRSYRLDANDILLNERELR